MNNFYRELKPSLIIVSAICLVTIFLQYYYKGSLAWNDVSRSLLFNVYFGFPLCLVNGYYFNALTIYYPWDTHPKKRAIIGVIGSVLITMFTLVVLNLFLGVFYYGQELSSLWSNQNKGFYMSALVITLIVTATIHAITFFQEIQREKKINVRLREEKLASELNALRSHVDPHFLFNSFNVLSGLIDEDTEKAQKFLTGLSKIYRYILENRHEETSSVEDELTFAQKYITLQKMRFEDSLEVETDISDEGRSKRIPSLSLQLLLENAIKHNGFSADNPLRIIIAEENDKLVVANNIATRNNIEKSSQMGLVNIKERYRLLVKKEIEIITDNNVFTVKLPLI